MANSVGVISGSSRRLPSSKPPAPSPPQKVFKCDSAEVQITEDKIPNTLSASHRQERQSQEHARGPHALMFRKLEDGGDYGGSKVQMHPLTSEEQKPSLSHSGEKVLATFYGMLYTKDGSEKEWNLKVDGFIPVFFVENANKQFLIIAVDGSKRIMEYQVNVNTACARSTTFVKWQDKSSMFGVRFAKEDQAEQFFSTLSRMASDVNNFALLIKKPERKEVIRKTSDPASSGIMHSINVSLIIKLPDKQTAVMSVPGLMTMKELFDLICGKENLNPKEHRLSLARTGTRKVTFDWNTAVGSLNIREVSVLRTRAGENSPGGVGNEDAIKDLVETQGERNMVVRIHLPSGVRKRFRVALGTSVEQLLVKVCSSEGLSCRHHSLQYVDFKHKFLDLSSVVAEIGVDEIRLMDKTEHRKSTGVESDSAPTSSQMDKRDRHLPVRSLRKSVSLKGLLDHKDEQETPEAFIVNGAVPSSKRRNCSDEAVKNKPPVPPLPYSLKSGHALKKQNDDLRGSDLKDHGVSPIQKGGGLYASSPDLSGSSSESGEWGPPVSRNIKTSTPETKTKRRAAPPPPTRPKPALPALDTAREAEVKHGESRLPEMHENSASTEALSRVVGASEPQKRPIQKRRPAPPRPFRHPPPQAAVQRVTQQGPVEKTETLAGSGVTDYSEHDRDIGSTNMAISLALDVPRHSSDSEEKGWRGAPIFIAPPPPDGLPPPLDECETPVEPLTDYEATFIAGSVEVLPIDVNGVGFHETPGGLTLSGSQHGNKQKHRGDLGEIQRVDFMPPLEDSKPFEKATFPIVPPPPAYSEIGSIQSNKEATVLVPSSSNEARSKDKDNCNDAVNVIPPPLLETEPCPMNIETEEKEHDSGFDQSPEYIILTPRKEPLESVPGGISEDPDCGSSFDVVSTIPPPKDFESRPITPPEEFANGTLSPPADFDTVSDGPKGEGEPESSRKKLNVSESLFPWLTEPEAPLDAAVVLAVPKLEENSLKLQDEASDTIARCEEQPSTRHSIQTKPQMVPVLQTTTPSQKGVLSDDEFVKRYIKSPQQMETWDQSVEVPVETAQQVPLVLETVKVESKSESLRMTTVNQNEEASSVKEWGNIEPHETGDGKSQRNERFSLTRPETKANPTTLVKETEVTVEAQAKGKGPSQPDTLVGSKENSRERLPVKAVSVPGQPEPNIDVVLTAESKLTGELLSRDVESTDDDAMSVQEQRPPDTKMNPHGAVTESEARGETETPIKPNLHVKDEPFKVSDKPNVELSLGLKAVTSEKTEEALSHDVGPNNVQSKEDRKYLNTASKTSLNTKSHPGMELEVKSPPLPQHNNVFETLITAKTKPVLSANDLLRDQERKFQDLGENIVLSLSQSSESRSEAVMDFPTERSAVKITTKAVSEDVIVPEKKQVDCASYAHLGEQLFQFETDDTTNTTVARETTSVVPVVDRHPAGVETSKPVLREGTVDFRLDLSSLRQTTPKPTLPRAPTTPPPSVSLGSTSVVADPVVDKHSTQVKSCKPLSTEGETELNVDLKVSRQTVEPTLARPSSSSLPAVSPGSTDGLSEASPKEQAGGEERTITGTQGNAVLKGSLSSKHDDEEAPKFVENVFTIEHGKQEPKGSLPATITPYNERKTADGKVVPPKLQRPFSLPAGFPRDPKSVVLESEKMSQPPEASSLAGAPKVGSSSSAVSSINVTTPTNAENLPRPPPSTVLPLRRYSNRAADVSFVSSAAKIAEREAETKKGPSVKAPTVPLKKSSTPALERPQSWVAPEGEPKRKSLVWSSAFRPVSFEPPGRKVVRPVEFAVKPPTVSAASTSTVKPSTAPAASTSTVKPSTVPAVSTSTVKPSTVPAASTSTVEPSIVPAASTSTVEPSTVPAASTSTVKPSTVPAASTSTVEPSTVPAASTSTVKPSIVPAASTSTVKPSTVAAASTSTVKPSTVPAASTSTVKPSTVPAATTSTVKPSAVAAASTSTVEPSTVPAASTSTVEPSTVPAASTSTVEPSIVPAVSTSTVKPSTVPAASTSTVKPSTVPASTSTAHSNENIQAAKPNEELQTASPKVETAENFKANPSCDKTPSDVMKSPVSTNVLENGNVIASTVSVSAKGDEAPVPRPVSDYSKVGRTVIDPPDSLGKKYEVLFSNKPSTTSSKIPEEGTRTKGENVRKGQEASMGSRPNYNVFSAVTNAPAKDISSAPVKRDEESDDKAFRGRPKSAIVGGLRFQILPGKEEASQQKENKEFKREVDPKKSARHQTDISQSAAPWKPPIDHTKKDLLQPSARSQEAVKPISQPHPAVESRTKTLNNPIKRHSFPKYTIEGTQQSPKKVGVPENKMHFVVEQGNTDTSVVPQGVVAAMKALREKQAREKKELTGGN